ncbi:MAG: hypothetical protein K6F49_11730 [Saccharofermentans sp.]|nr:hypothetical protein [Saccharofermentans sp.]
MDLGSDIILYILEEAVAIWNVFLSTAFTIVSTSPYDLGGDNNIFDAISTRIGDSISMIASSLLIVIWGIGVLRSASQIENQMRGPHHMFWQLFRLFVPASLIMSYKYVTSIIISLGVDALNQILLIDATELSEMEVESTVIAYLDSAGFWDKFFAFCISFGFLIQAVRYGSKIVLKVYGRLFSIYGMIFLAPIGLAMYGSQQTEHSAMRYLTSLGKVALHGVVIVIDLIIYNVFFTYMTSIDMFAGFSGTLSGWLLQNFFMMGVLYGLIEASEQFTERIL